MLPDFLNIKSIRFYKNKEKLNVFLDYGNITHKA